MNKDLVMTGELGGKHFAKELILAWLVNTGGSNAKLLETVTGLPPKILHPLLAEMMEEKTVRLDGIIKTPEKTPHFNAGDESGKVDKGVDR